MLIEVQFALAGAAAVISAITGTPSQTQDPPQANPAGPLVGMSDMSAPNLIRLAGVEQVNPDDYILVSAFHGDANTAIFNVTSQPKVSQDPDICQTDHVMFGARRTGSVAVVLGTEQFVGYQWRPQAGCASIDPDMNSMELLSLDEFKLKHPRPQGAQVE